ncbi:hypothetical protein BDB13_6199 [Rhodococcus sp. OK302]|nr:hypothetical protein BDB13_6199 [Rhodococcus sp. OK302]
MFDFPLWWWTLGLPKEWRDALRSVTPCQWWGGGVYCH